MPDPWFGPVIVVRTDASPTIGSGHAMRCLTLADDLVRRGARCIFVAVEMTSVMHQAIIGAGHRIAMIDAGEGSLSAGQQAQAEATAAISARAGATHLIVDHYHLDRVFAAHPGLANLRTLVIDDLADRPLACDLLVDQTVGRNAAAYRDVAPGAMVLVGGQYALLRPQFMAQRPKALQRRMQPRTAERLLISLGSTDLDGITARVLEAVRASDYKGAVDVVLGRQAPSRAAAEAIAAIDPRFVLHTDTNDMAALMVVADLAIGAAGTTTWERCALGLPTLTLVLADNQRLVAREIVKAKAAVLTKVDRLTTDMAMAADANALAAMSAAAFALVDGLGAPRVANAFLVPSTAIDRTASVSLRSATMADSEHLWLWRNDPVAREWSRSRAPILRADHERWIAAALASDSRRIWIAERDGHAVAGTRIDRNIDGGVISIMVAPDARGTGVGVQALAATCACWNEDACGGINTQLRAIIHDDNSASIRIFHHCGFAPENEGAVSHDGFRSYVRDGHINLETGTR